MPNVCWLMFFLELFGEETYIKTSGEHDGPVQRADPQRKISTSRQPLRPIQSLARNRFRCFFFYLSDRQNHLWLQLEAWQNTVEVR